MSAVASCNSQNTLLLNNLLTYYKNTNNLDNMLKIINGSCDENSANKNKISLRIVDWFTTNYAKKYYTVYTLSSGKRFKVYFDYKLKLRSYSKKRFDPFCRWERINIPYKDGAYIETTIGQLNFFKWAFENEVIKYIEDNYEDIQDDMNKRNSTSKRKQVANPNSTQKTRKKRQELSVSASKTIKNELVEIVVTFN
jgi:hypothetical protein